MSKKYDILVWGATGFTGQLIAEYLVKHGPKGLKLALGGRSKEKLEKLVDSVRAEEPDYKQEIGILVGDSKDKESLDKIVQQCKVVISAVGPYTLYGVPLVDSCVRLGVDYCDLTGEPPFIKLCIDQYHKKAQETGAAIVHASGYDSIPSDIGTYMIVEHFKNQYGDKTKEVKNFQLVKGGGPSGGTIYSAFNIYETSSWSQLIKMGDPYLLSEKKGKHGQTDITFPGYDRDLKGWSSPFIMAPVNAKVVRRSDSLLNYGTEFSYRESLGPLSSFSAFGITLGFAFAMLFIVVLPLRILLKRFLPQPGEGPSKFVIENSSFTSVLIGQSQEKGKKAKAVIQGFKDPGYGGTSIMIAETALSLLERNKVSGKGGVLTPASAVGSILVERLKKAGMKLEVKDL